MPMTPIMSETTADMSDSMAPSMATVKAGASNGRVMLNCNWGKLKAGSPLGMPPKRLPMVSTGSDGKRTTATVPSSSATIEPGTRRCHDFGHKTIIASDAAAKASVLHCTVPAFSMSTFIFSTNPEGTWSTFNPKKSLI